MIHAILIAFKNPQQTKTRWERDMFPALKTTGKPFAVTVMDNSPEHSPLLAETFGDDYLWQEGRNPMYGPTLNTAVLRRPTEELVLYCCSRHGRAYSDTWVNELLAPFADGNVGAAGHLMGSNSPNGVASDGGPGCEWVKEAYRFTDDYGVGQVPQHVQGGVFMARTGLMLRFPYPAQFPHNYTDHILTWNILKAGYKCVDVPTIKSVWRDKVYIRSGLSYIHDCWEE